LVGCVFWGDMVVYWDLLVIFAYIFLISFYQILI
jgi:hypothetical protein